MEQSPQTLRTQEGDSLSLNCSYTASSFRGLQWYRQDPGKGPELLFLLHSVGDEKQKERLRATLLKKGSSLHIEAPKPEDSATYLCAVQTQEFVLHRTTWEEALGAQEEGKQQRHPYSRAPASGFGYSLQVPGEHCVSTVQR